jgi:predicted Zn-dependent protease
MIGLAYSRGGSELAKSRPFAPRAQVTIDADGLYLVPLARYPQAELTEVGISVIRKAGAVDIRSSVGLGATTYDSQRNQFVAEELLRRLTESYRIGEGRTVLIVGVTSFDMYERGQAAKPSVSVARTADGRYAVVSTHLVDEAAARKAALRAILLDEVRRVGLGRRAT